MATSSPSHYRRIGWNGTEIVFPSSWQAKVSALHHLNFELNSKAIMEIRWQETDSKNVAKFIDTLTSQYTHLTGRNLIPGDLPSSCGLFDSAETFTFRGKKEERPIFTFGYFKSSMIFFMLQFHLERNGDHPLLDIQSINFNKLEHSSFLWSIQDFQVNVPTTFKLAKYTMKAGLTVLQFNHGKTLLNICRLALAGKRLQQESIEEIFYSLLGEEQPEKVKHLTPATLFYQNAPSILNQIGQRFQKKKPFRLATFWHDQEKDRLLGVFMEDIRPMSEKELQNIQASYEII